MQKPSKVVVYNKFSAESILAAAIAKTVDSGVYTAEATVRIPPDAEEYIWVGVKPSIIYFPQGPKDRAWKAKHTVIKTVQMVTGMSYGVDPGKIGEPPIDEALARVVGRAPNENTDDADFHDPVVSHVGRGLIQDTLAVLDIDPTPYMSVIYAAEKFYDRNTELDVLSLLYKNVKAAQQALSTRSGVYVVLERTASDDTTYVIASGECVEKLEEGQYRLPVLSLKGKTTKIMLTCINDDFWLVLRRIQLGYPNYVNIVMTINGMVVSSNFGTIKDIEVVASHFKIS